MLKLVLVGCGKSRIMKEYIEVLQNELRSFVKQYGFMLYNTNKLGRAEGNINALKKSRFSLVGKSEIEYWGITADADIDTYYYRWFEEKPDEGILNKPMDFNIRNLRKLVSQMVDDTTKVEKSRLYDLKVRFQLIEAIHNNVCITEIYLNDNKLYPTPKTVFNNMITKMDECCPDVFTSAYVTNESTSLAAVFYNDFRYEPDLLASKILDTGYMVYVSGKIERESGFEHKNDCSKYNICTLSNGTLYTLNDSAVGQGGLNKTGESIFNSILIPRYRRISWSDLCAADSFSVSASELVSVYAGKFSPNNPTLAFSYGYNANQLEEIFKCYNNKKCLGRCTVKELLETE